MRTFLLKTITIYALSTLASNSVFSQIIDFDRENPYKQVFVDTDIFNASYLDELEEAYPKIKTGTVKFSLLNDLAYYWHTRSLIKAMDFTRTGLRNTSEKKDSIWHGRFQITQGAILLRMEKLDSAQKVLESARCKVLETDLPFLNTQLGYVYERRGQLGKAADYALTSLELGKKLNDKKAIALAYSDLSNLFWKQSKFDIGLEYGLKSLEIFEQRRITDLDYDFTLYVVGNNYLALKEYKKAMHYYEHSKVIGEHYGFYNNLSDVYISLVDLYAYLKEFKKAEEAGINAVKYAELLENNFMLMRSWLSIGKMQNSENEHVAAIKSLQRCIEVATKDFGDAYYLSQAYQALGKAYAGNKNFQEAYAAFQEYDTLKSLIFTGEADQRISKLHAEFDVAQKESTIVLQNTRIKKQQVTQDLMILMGLLLILLLFLAFKAIQNKLKINKLLQKQNTEKEFLLKEIHHRVKNNLEIVSSLLSLQSAQIHDPNVLDAMQESQHRVQSMSIIHQKLYMGKNLATIEMKDYFANLSEYIVDAYGARKNVSVEVDMKKFELDVDLAIPIGLIVNELLTNSLKHAFPDKRKGKIKIGLKKINTLLQLDVIDNGVGQVVHTGSENNGFGTQLIELLTKQLDGKMALNTNQGTSVSIQFQFSKAA